MTAPRFLIVADGDFSAMTSKTANSVIRYLPERTVGVLDRTHAGRTVQPRVQFLPERVPRRPAPAPSPGPR